MPIDEARKTPKDRADPKMLVERRKNFAITPASRQFAFPIVALGVVVFQAGLRQVEFDRVDSPNGDTVSGRRHGDSCNNLIPTVFLNRMT